MTCNLTISCETYVMDVDIQNNNSSLVYFSVPEVRLFYSYCSKIIMIQHVKY